ncbi:MAG: oligosaccharide flippase family protein [Chloroflexi bacterium]|nr:oligosaccharide flippase family protein [Chloroflexota bacterium]
MGELIGLPDLSVYLPIYGWVILLTLAITLLDTALNSLLQQFAANLGLLLYSIVRAIGFYYVLTHDAGLIGILVAELIAVIVRFLVLIIAFILVLGKHLRMKAEFDDKMRRRIVDYGKWAYLNELGYLFFNTDTDNFIVGYYMGVADVGLYAFANKTARMVRDWSPIMISENVITPIFYERYSKTGDKAELDRMFGILNKLIYFINIPMLAGAIALNEKFIVLIFGEKYISATWLFVGILFYELMNGYQFPTSLVVFALEKINCIFIVEYFLSII